MSLLLALVGGGAAAGVVSILDAATRAACVAATSQQALLEALTAPFAAGHVTARLFSLPGVHLRTLTLPALSIESTAPRRITLGAHLADTAIATGTPGYWILRTAGGTDILRLGGDIVSHVGSVKALCTPTLDGVVIQADGALPLV